MNEDVHAGEAAPPAVAPGWLAAVALVWLAVMLRSVQVSLASGGDGALGITEAAFGLPAVVSAGLVGGAAAGLAARRLIGTRRLAGARLAARSAGRTARFTAALVAALVTGAAATGFVLLTYPVSAVRPVIAGTIAAGAAIGGAVAGVRAGAVVGAVVTASLGVLVLTVIRELFKGELLTLFGAGDTPASVLEAQRWMANATSLAGGLVAGLIAFGYLRFAVRRAGAAGTVRWPAYLVAGAGVGAMMLLTEGITRIGGGRVLALAGSVSESDRAFQDLANASRINAGLMVFFVGALTALIAFGRTLRPPAEPAPETAAEPAAHVDQGTGSTTRR